MATTEGFFAWISLLAGLASLGFGSSCSAIRFLGSDSIWCPSEQVFGSSITLCFVGLFTISCSVLVLQAVEEKDEILSEPNPIHSSPFILVKLRILALALVWLTCGGSFHAIFLLITAQCLARIANQFLVISPSVHKKLPALALVAISLILVLEALVCAYYLKTHLFVLCYFISALLFEGGELDNAEERLNWLDCFFALLLVAMFINSNRTAIVLGLLEVATLPVFYEHLAQRRQRLVLVDTGLAFASILEKENTFVLHALPVMSATALVHSSKSSSLGLWILIAQLFLSNDYTLLVLAIASLPLALELGPRAANRLHAWSSSLLKTGLVLFWSTCLGVLPLAIFSPTPAMLVFCFVLFSGNFEALHIVQGKIASEWNGERLGREQLVLDSAALCFSSLACAVVLSLSTTTTDTPAAGAAASPNNANHYRDFQVCNLFAVLTCCLGAAAYSLWFFQHRKGGAFRVIDEEGREVLSVTG